jgi:aromatic-L-amino-acid decarboxylase
MDPESFRRHAHEVVDWVADYLAEVDQYPVLAQVAPGDVRRRLPAEPPAEGEAMERILADFRDIVLPGVTHWNHPRFFAYFPANNSGPSILGELLSAALGVNGMLWQTCPAATELEELVMDWLRQLIGLPDSFRGVIQDTASTATLVSLLCARERATGQAVNERGFAAGSEGGPLRIYASTEGHSSVEKDRRRGMRPCAVVATVGTTSSTAVDPLGPVGEIARRQGLWLHVDAALAGSAAILPEKRWLLAGAEQADSLVFNPHKWLFTNFDCSAHFVRDLDTLLRTLAITPEYLRTDRDREVTNFRDWGVPLGRRFRALKLWFVLRSYGVAGLQQRLREHLELAQEFRGWVRQDGDFELLAPVPLNTICFRCRPANGAAPDEEALDRFNKELLDRVNMSGRVYLTHTRLRGRYTLRMSIGQTATRREHVAEAWQLLRETAGALARSG